MNRKLMMSVSALLAGAGFAAAQDVELASVRLANSNASRMGQVAACDQPSCVSGCASNCEINYRFYGSLEYLLWQLGDNFSNTDGSFVPNLRSPMPFGVATVNTDVFGVAFFSPTLLANNNVNSTDFSGARVTIGANLNNEWAFEASYFQLERLSAGYVGAASTQITGFNDGTDTFNPFVNVAVAGVGSRKLFGVEANAKYHGVTIGQVRISEIFGFRYLDLQQSQNLSQALQFVDAPGEAFLIGDNISTMNGAYSASNQFYGFTVGAKLDAEFGRFYTSLLGKFSGGGVREVTSISESVNTTSTVDNIPSTIFPSPLNSTSTKTEMAYVLEGNWSAGFHITEHFSIFAGYNIIVMDKAVRPIDNPAPVNGTGAVSLAPPTLIAPVLNVFESRRFYAQGLNVGLEFRY